jgi:hypothetical protein
VQDTDSDGIVSKDELLKAMTLLRGDFSEAEADAVKKLVAGKESVTLKQLEEYAFYVECAALFLSGESCFVHSEPQHLLLCRLGQKLALSKSSSGDDSSK